MESRTDRPLIPAKAEPTRLAFRRLRVEDGRDLDQASGRLRPDGHLTSPCVLILLTPSRHAQGYPLRRLADAWTFPAVGADGHVATAIAYAFRSTIVHGQWARFREDHRLEAGTAEQWLWQLLEREVELRVAGRRLKPLRAAGSAKFGA